MAVTGRRSTVPNGRTKSPKAPAIEPDKEQAQRFKETARKLEADETGEKFEAALRRVLPKP